VKRKTLHFRAIHKGKVYYVGKNVHLYYTEAWFGEGFAIAKLPPNTNAEDPHIIATCPMKGVGTAPPTEGWESDKYNEIKLTQARPADWIEGDSNVVKERVARLCAQLRKTSSKDGAFYISIRDICRNIDAVKEHLPELMTEFPKIDTDGNGKVTLEELDAYFDPVKKKEYGQEKLDEMWGILVSKRKPGDDRTKDRLFLEDLASNLEFVEDKIPALIECFGDVDLNRSCTIERTEFDGYFGSADIWLKSKLRNIIGLGDLKEQINKFYWQQRLDRLRRMGGCHVTGEESIVIMFKGSPGTGKTTIGRLIAGLLQKIDIIPTDTFVECQRDELVGDHIGATEVQTAKKIEEAKGGVLFVDEAYRLNADVFGVEAINCLMKAMTVKGTVMILAGYPKQMDEFVSANPGLKRRITYEMEFPDYSPEDLARILVTQIEKRGFKTDVPLEKLTELIGKNSSQEQRTCFNGGIGEHISRHAIFNLNESQVPLVQNKKKGEEPTPSISLTLDDIQYGCGQIPPPPPPETMQFKRAGDSKIRVPN